METIQQQLGALQEEIKRLREELEVVKKGNFDAITCQVWSVVDADGKERITAFTDPDGNAGVSWLDKDGDVRIVAKTFANGTACVLWLDKYGKLRIQASTFAHGIVSLPTEDYNPPK